jgi:hypothetical protein
VLIAISLVAKAPRPAFGDDRTSKNSFEKCFETDEKGVEGAEGDEGEERVEEKEEAGDWLGVGELVVADLISGSCGDLISFQCYQSLLVYDR